ncbi:uncharacterized protein LOC112589440 [Harpegnathos saltator]|uniref:uncharacterized protein LOC112589440 n=1 Tax=Harpegnathos saltator TaxID=610380 RepID=UPI000DBED36A|nr:uncharacterized protein LOC112589440 [Harpegnathos saltator]
MFRQRIFYNSGKENLIMENEMENIEVWCRDCNNIIDITEEHDCPIYNSNNSDINTKSKNDYIEKLITEVFEREPLWNSSLPYKFRGPSDIKVLWAEIDNCLGTTAGTSQIKWKNIRDRFVKEHALECAYIPSGSAAVKKKSTWSFYESLRFLTPTINYRRTKSNIENIDPTVPLASAKKESDESIISLISGPSTNTEKEDNISHKSLLQNRTSLKPQLMYPKKNYSFTPPYTSDSDSCDIKNKAFEESICRIKGTKKTKIVKKNDTSSLCEETILMELVRTRPADKPHTKPDEIECFTKYIEAYLRGMSADNSKRIKNIILKLIAEEDM